MTCIEREQVYRKITPLGKMIEFLDDVSINGGRARAEWYAPSTLAEAVSELWVEQYASEVSGKQIVKITECGWTKLKEYCNGDSE